MGPAAACFLASRAWECAACELLRAQRAVRRAGCGGLEHTPAILQAPGPPSRALAEAGRTNSHSLPNPTTHLPHRLVGAHASTVSGCWPGPVAAGLRPGRHRRRQRHWQQRLALSRAADAPHGRRRPVPAGAAAGRGDVAVRVGRCDSGRPGAAQGGRGCVQDRAAHGRHAPSLTAQGGALLLVAPKAHLPLP